MLSPLSATRPKCSAFQSTTIFRLPTPRKPPKSITAARTAPARSTMTSTMRPISSSAGLRTSRPSTPCASLAPMMVTEGGGAGAFGATEGAGFCCCGGCGAAGGEPGSFCARDVATVDAATAIATNMNKCPGRIWPPVARPEVASRFKCGPGRGFVRRTGGKSVRQHDRHLDLAARTQHLQRHLVAVTVNTEIDARRPKLQIAQQHFVEEGRQARVAQPNLAALGVKFEPEGGFQQREGRRTRPGLRRAGR